MGKRKLLKKLFKKRRPKKWGLKGRGFKGEFHFPGHNFTGPGTNLEERLRRGDKPVDPTDEASLQHDKDYVQIRKDLGARKINKKQALRRVRKADVRMLKKMFKDRGRSAMHSPQAVLSNTAATLAISGKVALEAIGVPITKWMKLLKD